jgi:hypothetical protein
MDASFRECAFVTPLSQQFCAAQQRATHALIAFDANDRTGAAGQVMQCQSAHSQDLS